mgnify:CR=1 FL=1
MRAVLGRIVAGLAALANVAPPGAGDATILHVGRVAAHRFASSSFFMPPVSTTPTTP